MARSNLLRFLVLTISVVMLLGCGGKKRPKTVPVSGTVLYNGKPVEGATVTFLVKDADKGATGVTDAEGKFKLSTYGANDGAVIGEHAVTVIKTEAAPAQQVSDPTAALNDPNALAKQSSASGEKKTMPTGPKMLLPAKYASGETSGLKETVTADGPNTFVLQLKD